MRYESRAYGTREEIEALLQQGYSTPGRSRRRLDEIEEAVIELRNGAEEIRYGQTLYIVEDDKPLNSE